ETLGEVMVSAGLVGADTMERALQVQRLVAVGKLDITRAADMLNKADCERISVRQAMQNEAPAILISSGSYAVDAEYIHLEEDFLEAGLRPGPSEPRKPRSHEEARARQMLTRLYERLEALHMRNSYLLNTLDAEARLDLPHSDLQKMQHKIQLAVD